MATVAVFALDFLYVGLIVGQGGPPSDTPLLAPFVAAYFAALGIGLGLSLMAPTWLKTALRGAAGGGLLLLAVLTGFSIGIAVLVAAGVAIAALVLTLAARPDRGSVVAAIIGVVFGVTVLVVGLQAAWSQIACPATGEGGGTVPSFIGSGPSYECNDGVLTVNR